MQGAHRCCSFLHPLCAELAGREHKVEWRRNVNGEWQEVYRYLCKTHSSGTEYLCKICGGGDRSHSMILCDRCDGGYHIDCLNSGEEFIVPAGKWFCNRCSIQGKNNAKNSYGFSDLSACSKRPRESATRIEEGAENYFAPRKNSKVGVSVRNKKGGNSAVDERKLNILDGRGCHDNLPYGQHFPMRDKCVLAAKNLPIISRHEIELQLMILDYKEKFGRLKFVLSSGQSLLFYGYGSKRRLLNDFADECLKFDGDVITVDGFNNDFDMLDLFQWVIKNGSGTEESDILPDENLLRHYGVEGNCQMSFLTVDCEDSLAIKAANIARYIASRRGSNGKNEEMPPLYLVFHNIDGPGMFNKSYHSALSSLLCFSKNCIRLVASVDNVNSISCWGSNVVANYNWVSAFGSAIFFFLDRELLYAH